MKTNCEFRIYLLSITNGPATDSLSDKLHLCDGNCSSCCCAILMLRFIAERCSDPAALIEDARKVLEKYPVR